MLLFGSGLGLVVAVALWIFCVFDAITTPEAKVRNLPKLAWVFLVVLTLDLGALLWLVLGRPWGAAGSRVGAREPRTGRAARWDPADAARPVRRVPSNPDDDPEFLANLSRRAEEQRRRQQDSDGS
jgi:Phospholipase_D-nuclease N-terminal